MTLKAKPEIARPLFASLDQIHIVAIHPNGLRNEGREFATSVDAALDYAAARNAEGMNVYWTVNAITPGTHKKPSKANIIGARFVHVDIDPPKTGGKFDKPVILEALEGMSCPPSFVLDSGGGLQAFWRLDGLCENWQSIEAINVQVKEYFDADACWNIDRLMRIPGFINYPDARKRARGRSPVLATILRDDDGTVYEPETLAASFPPARGGTGGASPTSRTAISLPADWEALDADALDLSALSELRQAIEAPPEGDRSKAGLACARLMANEGFTDAEIMGVLLNAANAVAAHFLDQSDPMRAVRRVIGVVRADGPENPAVSHRHVSYDIDEIRRNLEARIRPTIAVTPSPAPAPVRDGSDPQWLTDLGDGGLARFVRHVTACAPSPQPWVTLGAAISMFGAVAGRRYASPTNLRTNIYTIGICDSGGGKDHPLRQPVSLMVAAGLADHVGGSKIASGQGLVTAVKRSPSILFPIDEVGFLIAAAADKKRSPKHVTDIMDNLTEFYSLAGNTFLGTAYANDEEKPREVIEQPCLCLFGVTTPGVFWGSLSSGNVLDGSLARMLIFESDNNYPDPQHDAAPGEWPESLVELVRSVAAGAEGHEPFPLGIGAVQAPRPYTVPYADAEAAAFARELRMTQTRRLREHEGSNLTGIIARMAENAVKVALVKAVSDNPVRPAITRADLEFGLMVSTRSIDSLTKAVNERVADTEGEAKLKRVLRIIATAGTEGIAHEALARQCGFMGDRAQLARALDFLIDGEKVVMAEVDGAAGKRKRRVYFATGA